MKVWILIYFFRVYGHDGVVDNIEFRTLKECQFAASKIKSNFKPSDFRAICLEKTK